MFCPSPPQLLRVSEGAAWRIRTFSQSSIQSDDYLSAEEDELSDVFEDEESFTSIGGDVETTRDGEGGFFNFSLFETEWNISNWFGWGRADSKASQEEKPKVASNWNRQLRSLTRNSRQLDELKAEAGKYLQKATIPHELCEERNMEPEVQCWDEPSGVHFPLRGKYYLNNRKKIKTGVRPVYTLKSVDFYHSDKKVDHIAQRLKLPATENIPEDCPISPLLVINWQAPFYPPKLFAGKGVDGPGVNCVAVFSLRDGFVAEEEIHKGTLYAHTFELLKRFCADAREDDGSSSRERLKMIPAMPNLDEWCATGTFGRAEQALLRRFQNKPMLCRPQVKYFVGPEYIEVDLDIHLYQYATRRYFHSLKHVLKHGVMDMALTLEGRNSDQLPEQVLASLRLQKIDFDTDFPKVPPLPSL